MRIWKIAVTLTGIFFTFFAATVQATLIVENPDRTGMTRIEPTDDPLESFTTSDGVTIVFDDGTSDSGLVPMESPDWWDPSPDGAESTIVYTTGYPASNTITLDFSGTDVFAFALNIGANFGAMANVVATFSDGSVATSNPEWFPIGPGNSPGYGVFGDSGSCQSITQIQVDPHIMTWGIGNMAYSAGECTSVPEPGSLSLLGFGLLGLGLVVYRRNRLSPTA